MPSLRALVIWYGDRRLASAAAYLVGSDEQPESNRRSNRRRLSQGELLLCAAVTARGAGSYGSAEICGSDEELSNASAALATCALSPGPLLPTYFLASHLLTPSLPFLPSVSFPPPYWPSTSALPPSPSPSLSIPSSARS